MMLWDRSKHSSALKGSRPAPVQILTHQPQRLPSSWRVTWKSDCSHLQEARYKLVTCTTRLLYKIQGCKAGGPPPAARHWGTHFAFGLGNFKNCANGKWPRYLILNLPNVGTLKTHGLQRSSVQPTIAFSESKSNVNISFFTLRNIFIWLWARVDHSRSMIS